MNPRIPSLALSLLAAFTGPPWAANCSRIHSPLANTGVDPDAAGRAQCSLTEKSSELIVSRSKLTANTGHQIEVAGILGGTFTANRYFSAEVENVPYAAYALRVDGQSVAQIAVSTGADGSKGEVEFTTGEDNPDDLPLNCDEAGRAVAIREDGAALFSRVFPSF